MGDMPASVVSFEDVRAGANPFLHSRDRVGWDSNLLYWN